MGLFSSIFGGAGSDKADKNRQKAIDAFNAIKTPELSALQVQLDKYVQQGTITPQQAEATLLQSNAFNSIATDPSLEGAQKQALQQLQDIGTQGGLTAVDKAQLNDITNTQNQEAKGRLGAIQSNARERGIGGSGLELASALQNEQSAADRAANSGMDVAAQAQNRALAAIQGAGTQAGQMQAQQYSQAANKAQAQNAIDQFNATTSNNTNMYNTQAANAAQAQNLAEKQRIADTNTGTANTEKAMNAQAVQQQYQDALQKAQGTAGTYNSWANDATAAANKNQAADLSLLGGGISAGMTAFGGPAGAAVSKVAAPTPQPNTSWTQEKDNNALPFAQGGQVPEMSITPDDEADFAKFMAEMKQPKQMCSGGMAHYEEGGEVTPKPSPEPKKEEKKKEEPGLMERLGNLMSHNADVANNVDPDQPTKGPYDFKAGGKVPGMPKVKGDSPKNDTVPAMLSPGEVVLPRSIVKQPKEIPQFVDKATGKTDHVGMALDALMKHKKEQKGGK